MSDEKILLEGIAASSGHRDGEVTILRGPEEIDKMVEGNILVTTSTNPQMTPALLKASGVVTNRGGNMSHAAIVSREFGIPCVVGTEEATNILEDDTEIRVDGDKGVVYER